MNYKVTEFKNVIKFDFTVPYDEFSIYLGTALKGLLKEKLSAALTVKR